MLAVSFGPLIHRAFDGDDIGSASLGAHGSRAKWRLGDEMQIHTHRVAAIRR